MMKLTIFLLVLLVAGCHADLYLANPRGSNNRLNEDTAERTNGNRMFDSQNNARGGYNVCDKDDVTAFNGNDAANQLRRDPDNIYNTNMNSDNNAATGSNVQYPMMYYEGSRIEMQWTVQHGCGGNEATDPQKLNCNMVVQYACNQDHAPVGDAFNDVALTTNLADGTNTDNHAAVDCGDGNGAGDDRAAATAAAETASDTNGNGRHESQAFYCECQQRKRNQGLFVSSQNLNGDEAIYTRQNANGARRGLECTEERDYYPYWSPSPWRDLAYLTDDLSRCEMVQTESQNVKSKHKCTNYAGGKQILATTTTEPITQAACEAADGGKWMEYKSYFDPASDNAKPECLLGQYSRPNHLGNGRGDGISPTMVGYNATLPTFAALLDTTWNTGGSATVRVTAQNYVKCVMRLRYNVSTDDYDPWTVDSDLNGADNANAPIQNDPKVEIGLTGGALVELALNTAQYGRTFQDRSHTFWLRKMTTDMASDVAAGATIHNLNIRGKRCNIVQCYPAVEYDFAPSSLNVAQDDIVHMQWCGSLTHNNAAPAGDGQAGGDGEGTDGSDKGNLMQLKHFGDNFPVPMDKMELLGVKKYFGDENMCYQANNGADATLGAALTEMDCALRVATNGYYQNAADVATKDALNPQLNNVPAGSYHAGVLVKVKAPVGTKYIYMQTRNNNFSSRGAKGVTTVVKKKQPIGAL